MKILCRTLFDITKTNVSNRRKLMDVPSPEFTKQRNQQSNFETILQIISLRSQPENITSPEIEKTNLENWGTGYKNQDSYSWVFTFEIVHNAVFNNGSNELGNLYSDCEGVPMILGLDEFKELQNTINTTGPFTNIKFEIQK